MLIRKGRLQLPRNLPNWIAATMADLKLVEAPFTIEVALAISSFTFAHRDHADQFLAATAKVFNLTLVTAGEHLLRLPGIRVLANQ